MEQLSNISTLSVHLSRVLDDIGLNEVTVRKRREMSLYLEQKMLVHQEMLGKRGLLFIFGSRSEGTTTLELNSDIDVLLCYEPFKILQKLDEWEQGHDNLLMLRENTAPGYCRLQVLNKDRPEPEKTCRYQGLTFDECRRVIAMNTLFDHEQSIAFQSVRNGPAHTVHYPPVPDRDITYALMCRSRLASTEKWAERKRNSGWPTKRLIKQATNDPFFLVPVGYKLSSTKVMEWRISTSLAERRLMFSLNIVQIKCYVILKILIKTFLTPEVGKSISSYHCKTALLYCIESTKAEFWQESNLINSTLRCLKMLHAWVTDNVCPHFIIAEANLFAGKVTPENRSALQGVIRKLIENITQSLFDVCIEGLGHKLWMKLGTKPNSSPILDSIYTKEVLGNLEFNNHLTDETNFLINVSSRISSSVITSVRQTKTVFESRTNFSDKFQKEVTERANKFLSNLLGSLLASSSLGRHNRIPQEAIDLLDASATSDISFLLKQASILNCSTEVEKVEQLCMKISDQFKRNISYPVCRCYTSQFRFSSEQCQTMYNRKHEVQYAHCVAFTPHEIHCIPQALRYELFKAIGNDIHQRQLPDDRWMVLAVVDCLPLLYYLQYKVFRELGKGDLRKESLHNLEQCIREENQILFHRETVWNILGQCYEMENQSGAALQCYRQSLDIRPRNNAANWLVPLLLYRCTRGDSVPFFKTYRGCLLSYSLYSRCLMNGSREEP